MPDLNAWRGGTNSLGVASAAQRAADAWKRIEDRPSSITVTRGSGSGKTTLAAQTVRLEWNNTASRADQALTTTSIVQVVVFGVRGHATRPDTDLRTGDRFNVDGSAYEVIAVMKPPGEVQAVCQAVRTG